MNESKSFASLEPRLLARKGGAKPAMRPQPIIHIQDANALQLTDDLGWNDMGDQSDDDEPDGAEIVAINGAKAANGKKPQILRQRAGFTKKLAAQQRTFAKASASGRRVAFTLRIDPERHLRLRLACTILERSAQQLVTEALDNLLDEMPEVDSLADKVRKRV